MMLLRLPYGLLALVLLLTLAWPGSQLRADHKASFATQVQASTKLQQWIVVLHDQRPSRRLGRVSGVGYHRLQRLYEEDPALDRMAQAIAQDYSVQVLQQWPIRNLGVHCVVIQASAQAINHGLLQQIAADPRVDSVQPMQQFVSSGERPPEVVLPTAKPSLVNANIDTSETIADPYRALQVGLDLMHVTPVQNTLRGRNIVIALVDSQVDHQHPDLAHAIIAMEDFVGEQASSKAEHHGTAMAGIISAAAQNGRGIIGVAPEAGILAYRACWETTAQQQAQCNSLTLSRALDRVIDSKPDILNLSLTGPKDALLDRLIAKITAQGTIVITAFDDNRPKNQRFPSTAKGVLYGRNGSMVGMPAVAAQCLFAPGHKVLSAQPNMSYQFVSGHSVATAHVAGAVALLLEGWPSMDADSAHMALFDSTGSNHTDRSINIKKAVYQLRMQQAATYQAPSPLTSVAYQNPQYNK